MGFLDKVTKGITDTVDGISKAVTDVTTTNPAAGAPSTGGTVVYANQGGQGGQGGQDGQDGQEPWFIDSLDPAGWLTPEGLEGAAVFDGSVDATFRAAPEIFDRDDVIVVRFASDDGAVFTVDVASITEAYLSRFVSFEAAIESAKADLADWEDSNAGDFDLAIGGSTGDGHGRFIGCIGDAMGQIDVYGPTGRRYIDVAHNILFAAYHMDEN